MGRRAGKRKREGALLAAQPFTYAANRNKKLPEIEKGDRHLSKATIIAIGVYKNDRLLEKRSAFEADYGVDNTKAGPNYWM